MDRIAETARLVGGFTFTGTSRHFVQYRDAAAPFGYDATALVSTDAALALYHDRFSQTYDVERKIELRALLLRLMPRVDPATKLEPGLRFVVAEQGLGPALVHYFVRSHVEGEVCVAEWPPPSAFDDTPVRRWVMRVPELPDRMRPLLHIDPRDHELRSGGAGRGRRGGVPPPDRAARVPGLRCRRASCCCAGAATSRGRSSGCRRWARLTASLARRAAARRARRRRRRDGHARQPTRARAAAGRAVRARRGET